MHGCSGSRPVSPGYAQIAGECTRTSTPEAACAAPGRTVCPWLRAKPAEPWGGAVGDRRLRMADVNPMTEEARRHIRTLDGWRALAILLVLLDHGADPLLRFALGLMGHAGGFLSE